MIQRNYFYLIYTNRVGALAGHKIAEGHYGWTESGHPDYAEASSIVAFTRLLRVTPEKPEYIESAVVYGYDMDYNLVSETTIYNRHWQLLPGMNWKLELGNNEVSIAVQFKLTAEAEQAFLNDEFEDVYFTLDFATEVHPHYKQLKMAFKKETGQAFFRSSLDGKLTFHGDDYAKIVGGSYETEFKLEVYQEIVRENAVSQSVFVNTTWPFCTATFSYTDCVFDIGREMCEPKLVYDDKYTKILDKYDNTYDLIKSAPAITQLTLTKRAIVQIYLQGGATISNYSNGNYWETEVEEVNDPQALRNTYHFAQNGNIIQVKAQMPTGRIIRYDGDQTSSVWNSVTAENGEYVRGSMRFVLVARAGTPVPAGSDPCYLLSDGHSSNVGTATGNYMHDVYRIEFTALNDGEGFPFGVSKYLYGKDYPYFKMSDTPNTYQIDMYDQFGQVGSFYPEVTNNYVWARILCDRDSVEINGSTVPLYDVPTNDFTGLNKNYKKCIGLAGINSEDSFIKIYVSTNQSEQPSSYGMNSVGQYYNPPHNFYTANYYFYPLLRDIWGVASYWVYFNSTYLVPNGGFEGMCSRYNREFTLKDAWHLADVIKLLLNKIDPSIKHEHSPEYSQYLYGHSGPRCASALGQCDIYMTPKSNILVSEYDKPAQKAEIKLKQIMEMLRDCFRAYWYIDYDNRFCIEHISFFDKGLTYDSTPAIQESLRDREKFSGKPYYYGQQRFEFDKTNLPSRYEFKWMDDTTDAFGGLKVDVNNNYTQKDNTSEINISAFTPDVDYMLFKPDDFSKDGFALLMANANKKVPIAELHLQDERQFYAEYIFNSQNWPASFSNLINTYQEDMSGTDVHINLINYYVVRGVKKFIKQSVEFSTGQEVNPYELIRTDFGDGSIETIKQDIETGVVEADLRFGIRVNIAQ